MRTHLPSIPALVAALTFFAGCDLGHRSSPEGEPADAAVDALTAAPMCPYAPEPLGACEPLRSPEPACVVDVEGGRSIRQVAFDAMGRRIGDTSWVVRRLIHDEAGRVVRRETARDGCVTDLTTERPLGDGWLTRQNDDGGESCSYRVERGDTVVHLGIDPGCDCRDVHLLVDCDLGPHGPGRCAYYGPDGTLAFVSNCTYDAAGRRVGCSFDEDGDEAPDWEVNWVFDDEGRTIAEHVSWHGDEEPPECRYFTDETSPRRVTRDTDYGCDGSVESSERTEWDAQGRLVRWEFIDASGAVARQETVYDDDGGYRQTTTDDGRVVLTEVLVVEGDRLTWTETHRYGEALAVTVTIEERGALIERFQSVRSEQPDFFERRHDLYVRDERGLLVEQRSILERNDAVPRECMIRYFWSGACPEPPIDYDGEVCTQSGL